ncbi:MAG TPA: hypothetical protein VEG32_07845 [Clostridia bacterium]|nr:hypothetical protein [Clostridia bacterium]
MKYAAGVSVNVVNAVPIADGWGPMPDVTPFTDALPAACQGACYVRTSTGAHRMFAGTTTKLYEYNSSTNAWDDVSRASGGNYALPSADKWWFVAFGTRLIAGNLADDIQYIDIDAGTEFAALAGSPPKARYGWVAGAQLVLGHLATFPNRIMTSGIGDPTYWTAGRRGCDFQDFQDGEEVVGGVGSQGGSVIFQKSRIRSMSLLSGDVPFRTDILNPARGVAAPLSIANIGPGQFVYLSADGFFMNVEGRAIGLERVDRWFAQQIDRSKIAEVRALVDPYAKIVWFKAERPSGSKFLLGYCWPLDRWCYSDANVQEMASMVTVGMTIDGMADYWSTIDEISETYDSQLFTGGVPSFAVFNSDNEMCYVSGSPRAATLVTPDTQLTPGARTWLSKARLVTDAPTFTMRAITSAYHGDTRTEGSAVSPYSATGICHFRSSGLMHAFKAEIPAGTSWTHVTGVDFPDGGFRKEGQR